MFEIDLSPMGLLMMMVDNRNYCYCYCYSHLVMQIVDIGVILIAAVGWPVVGIVAIVIADIDLMAYVIVPMSVGHIIDIVSALIVFVVIPAVVGDFVVVAVVVSAFVLSLSYKQCSSEVDVLCSCSATRSRGEKLWKLSLILL